MKVWAIGLVLAAASASVQAQTSGWGAFEDGEGHGVGVQSPDGAQFMFKCDKPGAGEVYAVVATTSGLVAPAQTFVMRPVQVLYDHKPPYDDRWRFYEHAAIAINKGTERSLTRLLLDIKEAKTLRVQLDAEPRKRPPKIVNFDVAGAAQALEHVYASCQDTIPVN